MTAVSQVVRGEAESVRPVTRGDWALVEALFGPRGACGGCWCMYWLAPPGEVAWQQMRGGPNRDALRAQLESGQCHAVVAIGSDAPVGWCRAGPVGSFPRLLRSRKLARKNMADWAVTCFFVAPAERHRGWAARLLSEAVDLARRNGAGSIEGYPVVPRGKLPPPFAWTGLPAAFERNAFLPVDHDAGSRRIYRRDLVRSAPGALNLSDRGAGAG